MFDVTSIEYTNSVTRTSISMLWVNYSYLLQYQRPEQSLLVQIGLSEFVLQLQLWTFWNMPIEQMIDWC